MLINTTYTNKDELQLIDDVVGKSYSFLNKLRRHGIGSKRMIVDEVSKGLTQVMSVHQEITYASIEIRPAGILVHFNAERKSFIWAIPFYQLVIYKTNGASIHANGHFVHFKNTKQFKENKAFFKQLLQAKIDYDAQFKSPSML